jgi:large subunit ribosomal protein L1
MGKIRVKTLGDEEKEKKQKVEAHKRAEAKKAKEEAQNEKEGKEQSAQETKPETQAHKTAKSAKKEGSKKKQHSDNYLAVSQKVDKNKTYKLDDAVKLLEQLKRAKFDETVELHCNTVEKGISGNVTLPHGTGKEVRIEIVNQSEDPKHVEEVVKKVESGTIDFDVLIATPDSMPKLAKIARFLGPRGLMPNPKNGTVSQKPQDVAKKFQGGQVNFKTEAKFPILHMSIGKVSFGERKLVDNAKAAIEAIQIKNIKNATLKSTMSPGLRIDTSNL